MLEALRPGAVRADALAAVSAKRGEKIAITIPSSTRLTESSGNSVATSPVTARAGHQMKLSAGGASATTASEVRIAKRDSVPEDRIAATCRAMTKPAPM